VIIGAIAAVGVAQASLQGALQHAVVVTVRGHRIKTFGRIYVGLDLQRPLAPTVSLVPVDLCLP